MNTLIVIVFLLILILICGALLYVYIKSHNDISIKDNLCIVRAHYYMFTLDKYDYLIYVTSADKFSEDAILNTKKAILKKLNINESEDAINEIGVSYLGYLSETEFESNGL